MMKNYTGIKLIIFTLLISTATTHARTWTEWWKQTFKRPAWTTQYSWQEIKEKGVQGNAQAAFKAVKNNKEKAAIVLGVCATGAYIARNRIKKTWKRYAPPIFGGDNIVD